MVRSSFARLLGERLPLFHQRAERLLGRFLFFVNFAVALIVASGLFKPLLDLRNGRFLRRNFLFADRELAPRLLRREKEKSRSDRAAAILRAAAVALLVAGLAFNGVVPVNKSLWSSTFVCVVAAYSLAMFALFYYLIDVRGWRRWTLFFRVVGLNSITIYLAQRIVGFGRISDFFLGGVASKCPEALAAVVDSAGYVAVCWLFLYFLYRKNVFLKV